MLRTGKARRARELYEQAIAGDRRLEGSVAQSRQRLSRARGHEVRSRGVGEGTGDRAPLRGRAAAKGRADGAPRATQGGGVTLSSGARLAGIRRARPTAGTGALAQAQDVRACQQARTGEVPRAEVAPGAGSCTPLRINTVMTPVATCTCASGPCITIIRKRSCFPICHGSSSSGARTSPGSRRSRRQLRTSPPRLSLRSPVTAPGSGPTSTFRPAHQSTSGHHSITHSTGAYIRFGTIVRRSRITSRSAPRPRRCFPSCPCAIFPGVARRFLFGAQAAHQAATTHRHDQHALDRALAARDPRGLRLSGRCRRARLDRREGLGIRRQHRARSLERQREIRIILIFDIWNPLLSAAERDLDARFHCRHRPLLRRRRVRVWARDEARVARACCCSLRSRLPATRRRQREP